MFQYCIVQQFGIHGIKTNISEQYNIVSHINGMAGSLVLVTQQAPGEEADDDLRALLKRIMHSQQDPGEEREEDSREHLEKKHVLVTQQDEDQE